MTTTFFFYQCHAPSLRTDLVPLHQIAPTRLTRTSRPPCPHFFLRRIGARDRGPFLKAFRPILTARRPPTRPSRYSSYLDTFFGRSSEFRASCVLPSRLSYGGVFPPVFLIFWTRLPFVLCSTGLRRFPPRFPPSWTVNASSLLLFSTWTASFSPSLPRVLAPSPLPMSDSSRVYQTPQRWVLGNEGCVSLFLVSVSVSFNSFQG